MENYTEKNSSSTEKSNGSYATGQGNPLYNMFVTQLSRLHTVCAKEALARGFGQANLVRSIGETWFVDPDTAGALIGSTSWTVTPSSCRWTSHTNAPLRHP